MAQGGDLEGALFELGLDLCLEFLNFLVLIFKELGGLIFVNDSLAVADLKGFEILVENGLNLWFGLLDLVEEIGGVSEVTSLDLELVDGLLKIF